MKYLKEDAAFERRFFEDFTGDRQNLSKESIKSFIHTLLDAQREEVDAMVLHSTPGEVWMKHDDVLKLLYSNK